MASTFAIVLTCSTMWLAGQNPEMADQSADDIQQTAAVESKGSADTETKAGKDAEDKAPKLSEAERIARLQRTIESDQKELQAIKHSGEDPEGEYRTAETEFKKIDDDWTARRKEIDELRRANQNDKADRLAAESEELKATWQAAKDRFDLAINWRKTMREKAALLEKKIRQDTQALNTLSGNDTPAPGSAPVTPAPAPQPVPQAAETTPSAAPQETAPQGPAPAVETPAPMPLSPLAQLAPPVPVAPAAPKKVEEKASEPPESKRELAEAKKEADDRRAAAQAAERRVATLNERYEGLREEINAEQRLLELARTKADQSQSARDKLGKELQDTLANNPTQTASVWDKLSAADERYEDAREEVRKTQDRLDELQGELNGLQTEQLTALQEAKQKLEEADKAESKLNRLEKLFALIDLSQWFVDHGPKLLAILLGTLLLSVVARISGRHIALIVARSGIRGTARDRENRAITLVGVFRNTASIALITGGLLMALDEIGIPIAPLMGGAAVFGLAVAFGAQNLIRDYFSGFMVLLEDQYGVNDVVKIGDVAGAVEKITLRMTVLRDLEGAMHFIPHGSITTVTNLTHGWSRALIEVGVGYGESPDRVMSVLMDIGRELRKDPTYGPLILDGPEMLGLDSLGDSSVSFKFFLKTQPTQRWFVRRELLRRIKNKFDELGIEIPFPQRTIHVRQEGETGMAALAAVGSVE